MIRASMARPPSEAAAPAARTGPALNLSSTLASKAQLPRRVPESPASAMLLSPWTVLRGAWQSQSFHDFMLHGGMYRRRGATVAVSPRTGVAPSGRHPPACPGDDCHHRVCVRTCLRPGPRIAPFSARHVRHVRAQHGDVVHINLWPVLPPIYLMMGKAANRGVLSQQDAALEQVLQELINVLPVSAKIPSEVDVELQRKVRWRPSVVPIHARPETQALWLRVLVCARHGLVGLAAASRRHVILCGTPQVASFFQSGAVVDALLPSFLEATRRLREGWLARPDPAARLDVFFELSEYVLRADLEVLYGKSFCDTCAAPRTRRGGARRVSPVTPRPAWIVQVRRPHHAKVPRVGGEHR